MTVVNYSVLRADLACTMNRSVQHTLSGSRHARRSYASGRTNGGAAIFNKVLPHGCCVRGCVRLCEKISNRLSDAFTGIPYDVKLVEFNAALA